MYSEDCRTEGILPLACISFRRAPIDVREQVVRRATPHEAACGPLSRAFGPHWVVVTCHRIEVYVALPEDAAPGSLAHKLLDALAVRRELAVHARVYASWDAARHALEVAAGLDSAVVGEPQILHQMTEAARLQEARGCMDQLLARFARRVCRAGARLRDRSGLSAYPSSLAEATADCLLSRLHAPSERRGLILGTGTVAHDLLRALWGKVGWLGVAGRRLARARSLAARYSAAPLPLEEALRLLPDLDFAVFALHLQNPLLLPLESLPKGFLLIDLGMPRNVAVGHGFFRGRAYLDVDHLSPSLRSGPLESAIRRAAQFMAGELESLKAWYGKWAVSPGASDLHRWASQLVEAELTRSQGWLRHLEAAHKARVETLARSLVRKLLARPLDFMQRHPHEGPATVLRIFGLEQPDG